MWPVPAPTTVAADSTTPDSFTKDGRKIRVGDCALFKPPQDSPPFIGIIRSLKFGKEDNLRLGVNWLYRPADVKLGKGILLEAAPNEVFYSFHKDEIPAASLLHPCKVAFLRKGFELPSGISSFVCRRVYDIENKCLWWLTDKDYINERQEEVDQLLDKTRLEMHGAVQSGGRSPKPLNGPTSTTQLKPGSDSIQNSTSSFSSQVKGKKRERGDQGSESVKRERLCKTEDGDSSQFRPENMLKSEIAKITDKGGLVNFEGVEKLVQLMQPDSTEKKIDLTGRIMLVDVIAVTDRLDCLGWFVQLRGLPVLNEWLQEVHKGKIGDGSSSTKESDKSVEEFLLALLRALDKLPVNLQALQTCNVGKSVNYLRSHKNSEIQKKARGLVDTWKKRVEAEMKWIENAKSGSNRGVSWSGKPVSSEVSHVGNKKTGGSAEVGSKSSIVQPSASKSPLIKVGSGEAVAKFNSASPGSTKSTATSVGINSKDLNTKMVVGVGTSDPPLTPIKEEKSSSSSQSQNNSHSCSSDHAKTGGSSFREDARSSTAVSVNANKISGSSSRHRKSSNGLLGSAVSGVQKESGFNKVCPLNRNSPSEKASPTSVAHERGSDVPFVDHGNSQRLIVRLPNTGRSPARSASGGSFEDPSAMFGRASPPGHSERHEHHDRKVKGKSDALRANVALNAKTELSEGKDGLAGSDEDNASPAPVLCDDWRKAGEDGETLVEASKAAGLSSGITPKSGKSYEASFSSINALIESCAKFSEASASTSPGDDIGMNLLASVAAGEMSKSDIASPLGSPNRNLPVPEDSCSGNDTKLRQLDEDIASQGQPNDGSNCDAIVEQRNTVDSVQVKNGLQHPSTPVSTNFSGRSKINMFGCEEKTGEYGVQLNSSSSDLKRNAVDPCLTPDWKPGEATSDASVPVSFVDVTNEGNTESEGANQFHEQRKSGALKAESNSVSDSILKVRNPFVDEDNKGDFADEKIVENGTSSVLEAAPASAKVESETIDESPCSTSEIFGEANNVVHKESSSSIVIDQKSPLIIKSCEESIEGKSDDAVLISSSGNALGMECKAEKPDDVKAGSHVEQSERQRNDSGSSISEHNSECAEDNSDRKEALGRCSGRSPLLEESLATSVRETEQCVKPSECKLDGVDVDRMEERHNSNAKAASSCAAGSDMAIKLDFDLNEGFPVDDGCQGELVKSPAPGSSFAMHLSSPLSFPISSTSGSFPASITVAAAAKGPFVPPENLLRTKGELGWKGSAATSAFRPAEPRKVLEMSLNTTDIPLVDATSRKQGRPPLDIDLNVPDERVLEDVAAQNPARVTYSEAGPRDRSAGGLDLDLNRADESPDMQLSVSNSCRLENPPLAGRSSLSGGFSNGEVSVSRDFDLNNGPSLDEMGGETAPRSHHTKSNVPFLSPVPSVRMNDTDLRNISSWFPPGNSYSAITIPSILPSRGEQNYPIVTAAGSQRLLGPPAGSTSFGPEMYRGPVLSSSPAVAFPPASPFQYPGFPFETSFPLSSNSFSGSTAYIDSSSGGASCFPTIPSQLVGPASVVSPHYPRPYVMGHPGGTSNVSPESRKWGSQGLDLNAGPGGTDMERRDERLPSALRQLPVAGSQALADEQLKMYQVPGGLLKRKEPDGGWDAADRFSYKQPSWQ